MGSQSIVVVCAHCRGEIALELQTGSNVLLCRTLAQSRMHGTEICCPLCGQFFIYAGETADSPQPKGAIAVAPALSEIPRAP